MPTHVLTLRHSGLVAKRGAVDAADAGKAMLGVRQLLSASAHYYTRGQIPAQLTTRNMHFQILEVAPSRGSWKSDLLINFAKEAQKYTFPDLLILVLAIGTGAIIASYGYKW
jgi:hypothetical protein